MRTLLPFTKMHGLGNDFIVINALTKPFSLTPLQIRYLANRHTGIGCDQLLVVEPPTQPMVDFRYRIFNADGSEVQQCGNGARCFAKYVRDKNLTTKNLLHVETMAGIIHLHLRPDGNVTVNMGKPRFLPTEIPFQAEETALFYPLEVDDRVYQISVVSMGNPHAILIVDNVRDAPVQTLGAKIEQHPRFPERVNVGFMQILDKHQIRLRVFERGVGETFACGTGACAAVVAGQRAGLLNTSVIVQLHYGQLHIEWAVNDTATVSMSGPATCVFEGTIEL
ncbi:diaminopimelate epimerase [Beggiatoa leptomitoformis]|uniref:Diaminopimelate epimerase n=1 Tax=Beggiatoa leptomitoformis TaxID=288004 RepID=A0A2N9YG66_9GAMM|nr:diaminopimelate epimerase [Beggiatoa leptomitoformis]ALG68179.1 diaminopimelate epimerase [Beggiatoa leptomitoformis]AUI69518.1 diaminopimelate epimerase [Beggiatoa leptomitoformis]